MNKGIARPIGVPYKQVMDILKKYRISRGLYQHELAALLGVSQPTYSRLESGLEFPSLRLAARIHKITRGKVKFTSWYPHDDPDMGYLKEWIKAPKKGRALPDSIFPEYKS